MNSSMYTIFVARSIVHVKHVGGGGIVGHFIFFGIKVSKSQKQILKFSFEPKKNENKNIFVRFWFKLKL